MSESTVETDGAVVVRVVRQDPAPLVVSAANCTVFGVAPEDWRRVVRALGVPYRRVGHDLFVDAAELRAALTSGAKPAPKRTRAKPPPATDDHRAVLEAARFVRRGS